MRHQTHTTHKHKSQNTHAPARLHQRRHPRRITCSQITSSTMHKEMECAQISRNGTVVDGCALQSITHIRIRTKRQQQQHHAHINLVHVFTCDMQQCQPVLLMLARVAQCLGVAWRGGTERGAYNTHVGREHSMVQAGRVLFTALRQTELAPVPSRRPCSSTVAHCESRRGGK